MSATLPDIQPITRPGIYTMDEDRYHADPCPTPSLSHSVAKTLLARSPAHAWTEHPRLNPKFEPKESKAFDRGRAAHALLLEGDDRMVVVDARDWRTTAAKEQRDAARAAGRCPVLAEDYRAVQDMVRVARAALDANRDMSGVKLSHGHAEQAMFWQEGDLWLRGRPDWLSADLGVFLDYKTTAASASPDDVVRTIVNQGYDVQDAFYRRGLAKICGHGGARFIFMFQEDAPPYACSFVALSPAFLAMGEAKVDSAIEQWRACMAKNDWPGYPHRIAYLDPPAFYMQRWEERVGQRGAGNPYDPAEMWPDLPDGD